MEAPQFVWPVTHWKVSRLFLILAVTNIAAFNVQVQGFFVSITSVVKSKNSLPISKFQRFSSLSFSQSFIVLCFKLMIPCTKCEVEVKVLPGYGYLIFPAPFVEKVILLSLNWFFVFVNITWTYLCGTVSKFSILLHCLLLSQEHMVLSTGALESDLTLYRMILTLFFLWKRILSGFRSFSFSYAFQNKTVYVYKNLPNFEGYCIKPIYQFQEN